MDFATSLKVLLGRWYVVLPALLVTLGACFFTVAKVPPTYQATGSLVLLVPPTVAQGQPPSAQRVVAGPVNPYLEFGSSISVTAEVISKAMMSDATVRQLRELGATAKYEVGNGVNGGPIINVVSTGANQREALTTLAVVTRAVQQELASRQREAGAPATTRLTAEVVTMPERADKLQGDRIRALGAVAILGLALSISLGFMAESVMEGRRRRSVHRLRRLARRLPSAATSEDFTGSTRR